MTAPVLQIDCVSKRFGDFIAVDGVSLNLQAGEFFTLLGPSGCGKTTLLRMLSGFETPNSGSIILDGVDVTAAPPYRRNVNQVFQSYALFPHLSVRRNIEFGLKMKGLARAERTKKVDESLALVALTGLGDRKPQQLSGGQRQRVALARSLVCEPRVLLLDEPLAALDAKLRRAMQGELKRLQARVGITFVFVTHDQEEALTLSDRIGVMNGGRLQQVGTAAEVYHRPATGFVASFLGHANLHPGVVDAATNVIVLNDGTRLETASRRLHASGVSISVRPEHIQILSDRPAGPNVFECTIVERLFKGASDHLTLQSVGGQIWTATRFNGASEAITTAPGQAMFAKIRPEDVVVIAEDQTATV